MKNKINCFLVEDDLVDRLTVISYFKEFPFLELVGIYESPLQALEDALKKPPDALFLDIDMPEMSGLELRNRLMDIPACIFLTSYPEYAVESFEVNPLDFLVKPFTKERFSKAIGKLQYFTELNKKSELLEHTLGHDTLFIKDGNTRFKIQMHEILFLEALNDYTLIHTTEKRYSVLKPLGSLIQEKPFNNFIRIHKSYAVQKHYIEKFNTAKIFLKEVELPIGRSFKDSVMASLHSGN